MQVLEFKLEPDVKRTAGRLTPIGAATTKLEHAFHSLMIQ